MIFKRYYLLPIFTLVIFLLSNTCSNENEAELLPTFATIETNEKIIFFDDLSNIPNRIYAVDTEKEKVIYIYNFNLKKRTVIYDFTYDPSFDINPYITLMNGPALKFNVKSGKLIEIKTKFTPCDYLAIIDNRLWITPVTSIIARENSPLDYLIYDAKTNESYYKTLPEGLFCGGQNNSAFINGKYYLSIYLNGREDKIYNLTDMKMVGNSLSLGQPYSIYFITNHFLQGIITGTPDKRDIYYLTSFEPLFVEFLFSDPDFTLLASYEKGNFIYLIEGVGENLRITKRDKNDIHTAIATRTFDDSRSRKTYCIGDYIWVISRSNRGAYKISMEDLSYTVIK